MSKKEDTTAPVDLKKFAKKLNETLTKEVPASCPADMSNKMFTVTRWLQLPPNLAYIYDMPALPFGQLIHLYGKKNVGKSSIMMELLAACQTQGVLPVLVLTEHKFDWNRFEHMFGGDSEALQLLEPEFVPDVFTTIDGILDRLKKDPKHPPIWICWDSIGATDLKDLDTADWDKDNGRTAQAVKKLMKRLHRRVHRDDDIKDRVGFYFLNQAWDKRTPNGLAILTPNGGESTQHYYSIEASLKRTGSQHGTVNKRKAKIAEKIKVEVTKNHITGSEPVSDVFVCGGGLAHTKDELKTRAKKFQQYRRSVQGLEETSVDDVALGEEEEDDDVD